MTRISTDAPVVTLVNVFTVRPEHQQELVEVLVEATDKVMRKLPGYVSANIHRSLDGTRVVNYAQWASEAAFQAMLRNPAVWPHMEAATRLGAADPVLYEVVHCDERAALTASAA
jgi:quinol monooxygenase YgiN